MKYFTEDEFTLYRGNCLELLSQIDVDSVDMIFADPPYNLSNNGITCQSGRMVSVNKGKWDVSKGVENDFEFHKAWIQAARRVLKPSGTMWISGTYHSIYACGYALQLLGFHLLNDICWFKPNASPNLSCRFFTASHETLIWAKKGKTASHVFNYNQMKLQGNKDDFLKKPNSQMRSVWAIAPPSPTEKQEGKHPTQKPIKLLRRIVIASTSEGQTVLDPFNGSGTTGLAAIEVGRKYIGIDMEQSYLDLTIKRYRTLQKALAAKKKQAILF